MGVFGFAWEDRCLTSPGRSTIRCARHSAHGIYKETRRAKNNVRHSHIYSKDPGYRGERRQDFHIGLYSPYAGFYFSSRSRTGAFSFPFYKGGRVPRESKVYGLTIVEWLSLLRTTDRLGAVSCIYLFVFATLLWCESGVNDTWDMRFSDQVDTCSDSSCTERHWSS